MQSVRTLICVAAVALLFAGGGPIWGAHASADPVVTLLQSPRFEISNGRVRVWCQSEQGVWGMAAGDGSAELSGNVVAVRLGDQQIRSSEPCRRSARRQQGRDDRGDFVRLEVSHTGLPHLTELVWSATLRPGAPCAVLRASVRIASDAPGPLQSLELISSAQTPLLRFGADPAGWMCFHDSGGQGGTGVTPFFVGDRARQSSPATLVVHDGRARRSLLVGWLSWANSNPSVLLGGSKSEGLREASAGCSYYARDVMADAASEPLLVSFEPDPLLALEEYAQEVRLVNKPPLRKDNVLGWLSWYCSRLRMTEQFVLDNAQVMAQRFRVYGVNTMQVDHGWEYRDVVGHWVANQRFPHGMKWLGRELEKLHMKLGIWMAVSRVSEFAPFYAEHPEAMIHKPDGSPWVFIERWTWAPHGRVFNLDPTHPFAQEHYRQSLQGLMDAGCRYYKVDFIGSAGVTEALFHDPRRPRGNPMVRYEMQQIRDAIGPDSWLRYCSSPSNVYCGIVNIGGATMDIGNAAGNWEHLAKYHQQLGSCWYKHRTFWHNEPDALIVGEGKENEARLRCAWLVLSGGVAALGDDLSRIAPDRLALIPKCLPPYDVAAQPLDLFEHVPARLWHLRVRRPWDDYHVVGLFNLDPQDARITIPLSRLGLDGSQTVAWEFWTQSPLEVRGQGLTVTAPARDSRIVVLRKAAGHPQVLATDMHLSMGGVELTEVKWDSASGMLSGRARRARGETGQLFIHVPPEWEWLGGGARQSDQVVTVPLRFQDPEAAWVVQFRPADNVKKSSQASLAIREFQSRPAVLRPGEPLELSLSLDRRRVKSLQLSDVFYVAPAEALAGFTYDAEKKKGIRPIELPAATREGGGSAVAVAAKLATGEWPPGVRRLMLQALDSQGRVIDERAFAVKVRDPRDRLDVTVEPSTFLAPGTHFNRFLKLGDGTLLTEGKLSRDGGQTWSGASAGFGNGAEQLRDGSVLGLDYRCVPIKGKTGCYEVARHFSPDGQRFDEGRAEMFVPEAKGAMGHAPHVGPLFMRSILQRADGSLAALMGGWFKSDIALCPYGRGRPYSRTYVCESADGGKSWRYLSTIGYEQIGSEGFNEGSMKRLPDGAWLAALRSGNERDFLCQDNPIMYSVSRDEGRSWSAPQRTGLEGCFPSLAVLSDGQLAMSYGRPGAMLAFSADNGRTWTDATCIDATPYSGYTDVVEIEPGLLLVGFGAAGYLDPQTGRRSNDLRLARVRYRTR